MGGRERENRLGGRERLTRSRKRIEMLVEEKKNKEEDWKEDGGMERRG